MVHVVSSWFNIRNESELAVLCKEEIESVLPVVRLAAERTLIEHQAENYEVSLLIGNDQELRTLNQEYRSINKPTDVLAFPMIDVQKIGCQDRHVQTDRPLILGDIAISISTAKRQASVHSHSLEMELVVLTVHGILHLLGYDHVNEEEAKYMFKEQKRISSQISDILGWSSKTTSYCINREEH